MVDRGILGISGIVLAQCPFGLNRAIPSVVRTSDSVLLAETSGATFLDRCESSSPKSLNWKGKVATILVLDEETDSRMLLKRVLEMNGHHVTACGDPAQALAQAASGPFDLAILSVTTSWSSLARLPGMLKAANSRLRVMTIADHRVEKVSENYPVDALVFRPADLDVIEAKVKELLLSDA